MSKLAKGTDVAASGNTVELGLDFGVGFFFAFGR